LALIKPDSYTNIGKIIQAIEDAGFIINNLKMTKFSLRDAQGNNKARILDFFMFWLQTNWKITCLFQKWKRCVFKDFYSEHRGKPFFEELTRYMCSDFIVAIELIGNDCINQWKQVMGPTNCQVREIFVWWLFRLKTYLVRLLVWMLLRVSELSMDRMELRTACMGVKMVSFII